MWKDINSPNSLILVVREIVMVLLMEKEIHLKIDKNDPDMTLRVVMEKIQDLQADNPDLEVFFDGDEYAICSRPKRDI